ncbi:MAG: RsmB/NOP family class I SAM-dependent RNA methyltransferase, partial [Acidilobaceae archaeon]
AFKRVCKGVCAKSSDEREVLYELAWRFVRDYNSLLCTSNSKSKPRELAELWLSKGGLIDKEYLREPHCKASVRKWFFESISSIIGTDEAIRLFQAMDKRVWWLRVNLFKASLENVVSSLEREGVELEVNKHYPYMIKILKTPKPVRSLKPVREFKAIPHDIASAVVVEELEPQPGDVILDACAAPGIKSSLISMLTEGKAKVIAVDISYRRLQIMRSLMRKLKVPENSIEIKHADARKIKVESATKSLIDAPCSNSGALSKDPGLRLTLTRGKVEYYAKIQREILLNILGQTKEFIYAVCSIMPDEGEAHMKSIAGVYRVEFKPPRSPLCKPGYYSSRPDVCRLYPHISESEGFFIAHVIILDLLH